MNIFLFYDSEDRPTAHNLLGMLQPEITSSKLAVRTPEHLVSGKPLHQEIETWMTDCSVFVLFVSAQVYTLPAYQIIEPILLDRLQRNEIRIFQVLVRHCLWASSGIAKQGIQPIPGADEWLSALSAIEQKEQLQTIKNRLISLIPSTSTLTEEAKQRIKQLIADNRLTNSFKALKEEIGPDNSDLLALERQLNNIKKKEILGTISSDNLFTQQNLLVENLLKFIDQYGQDIPAETESTPKSILYLSANPIGKAPTLFELQRKGIYDVLETYKEVIFTSRPQVEAFKLLKELTQHPSSIVHLSMHGTRQGELLFVDGDNNADGITVDRLFRIFEQLKAQDMLPDLLLINACHSVGHAERLAAIVPHTIGIKGAIPVPAAIKFTNVFYLNHLAGATIQFAFEEAVLAIKEPNSKESDGDQIHEMPHYFNKNNRI